MEKRIDLEKRHRTPDQVTELNLDNCRSTSIEGLTEEFVNLHTLSLIGVGLTSLKGFPKLAKLKKLELSDNRISGGLQILKDCEKLAVLNLSNNKIKDLTCIQELKGLANLRMLDLYRNDVTSTENYRDKVFEMLPNLTYLDGTDRNGKEYEESDVEDEESEIKMNGSKNNEEVDSDSVEDGSDAEEEEDESEEEVGLKDIYNDNLEDDSDSDMYDEGEEEDEEEDISDDSDDVDIASGNASGGRASNNATVENNEDGADEEEEEGEEEEDAGEEEEDGAADEDDNDQSVPRGTKRKFEDEEEAGN